MIKIYVLREKIEGLQIINEILSGSIRNMDEKY